MAISKQEFIDIVNSLEYAFKPRIDTQVSQAVHNEVMKAIHATLREEIRNAVRETVRETVEVTVSCK